MAIFQTETWTDAVAPGDPGGPDGHKIGNDGFGFRPEEFKATNASMFPGAHTLMAELFSVGPHSPRTFGYPSAPVIEKFTPAFDDDAALGLVLERFDGLNVSAADYSGPTPAPKQPGGDQGANVVVAARSAGARGADTGVNSGLGGSMDDEARQAAVGG